MIIFECTRLYSPLSLRQGSPYKMTRKTNFCNAKCKFTQLYNHLLNISFSQAGSRIFLKFMQSLQVLKYLIRKKTSIKRIFWRGKHGFIFINYVSK